MNYYILEGRNQNGPFSIEQIQSTGIKPHTLVWGENYDNWRRVEDVPELKDFIIKLPPPPIPNDDDVKFSQDSNLNSSNVNAGIENSEFRKLKRSRRLIFTFLLAVVLGVGISCIIYLIQRSILYDDFHYKVENVFGGNTIVQDGEIYNVVGVIEEVSVLKAKKREALKNFKSISDGNQGRNTASVNNKVDFQDLLQEWYEREKIYSVFTVSEGGFTIKKLSKRGDIGYDLEIYTSGNMGYRKPKISYVKPQYSPWGDLVYPGYNEVTDRPTVQECYNDAYNYLLKINEGVFYQAGKMIDIGNFPDIRNKYFYLKNTMPSQYSSTESYGYKWNSSGAISNDDFKVNYSIEGQHYELVANKERIKKDIVISFLITWGFVYLVIIIISVLRKS